MKTARLRSRSDFDMDRMAPRGATEAAPAARNDHHPTALANRVENRGALTTYAAGCGSATPNETRILRATRQPGCGGRPLSARAPAKPAAAGVEIADRPAGTRLVDRELAIAEIVAVERGDRGLGLALVGHF